MQFDPDFADPTDWATMYRDRGLQVVPAMSPREDAKQWKRPIIPWRGLENDLVPGTMNSVGILQSLANMDYIFTPIIADRLV